jgi:hypothetical protein
VITFIHCYRHFRRSGRSFTATIADALRVGREGF